MFYGETLVEKQDRLPVVDLILKGTPCRTLRKNSNQGQYLVSSTSFLHDRPTLFMEAVTTVFPTVQWKYLKYEYGVSVAPVATLGQTLAWRNGWNRGPRNFLIYHENKFYYRQTVGDTVEFLRILIGGPEVYPLFISSSCKLNKAIVINALKGDQPCPTNSKD